MKTSRIVGNHAMSAPVQSAVHTIVPKMTHVSTYWFRHHTRMNSLGSDTFNANRQLLSVLKNLVFPVGRSILLRPRLVPLSFQVV